MVRHFRRITCFPVKRIINKLITRRRKRRLMALMSKTIHIEMKETDPCLLLFLERTRSCGPCVPYWPQLTNARFSTGQKCRHVCPYRQLSHLSRRDGSIHTGTKNFPAQILSGFYYRHAGGKTVFKRVTLGIVWHSYTIYILYIFRILDIFRRSLQIQRLQIQRVTLKAGTVEWWNSGMAENDSKS